MKLAKRRRPANIREAVSSQICHDSGVTHELRFPMDADTLELATQYLKNRALQILMDGFCPVSIVPLEEEGVCWGVRALCKDPGGRVWQSVYTLASHRGRGHMSRYLRASPIPVITTPDCHIEEYLRARGIEYRVAGRFTESCEYVAVQSFYGNRRAERSGLFYMNHIDEGLAVLAHLGATERAWRAFCLHPLLQADSDLAQSFPRTAELTQSPHVLVLAMEYRNIANGYLSKMEPREPSEIHLGPLSEVHDMLRADKIQNFKDFLLCHRQSHPRSAALERYFRNWLIRLGVDRETFALLFERLQAQPIPRRLDLDMSAGIASLAFAVIS